MNTVTAVREGADDVYADAKAINDHAARRRRPPLWWRIPPRKGKQGGVIHDAQYRT